MGILMGEKMKETVEQKTMQGLAPWFRYLILAGAIGVYSLIVVGIVVRVTGSGSACPDWPTCSGQWAPPAGDTNAWIAYLHRLMAGLVGGLILTGAGLAWLRFRRFVWVTIPLFIALVLISLQMLWGGLTVRLAMPAEAVALHLGLALTIQTMLIVATAAAFFLSRNLRPSVRLVYRSPFARLSLITLGATFALLVSGAGVSASGGSAACTGWPLCNGALASGDLLAWTHLIHRLISGAAGLLMLALLIQGWRTQRSQTAILVATTAAAVLFFAQVLMGAYNAANQYPVYLVGLHVATAAAVWVALVVQAVLTGLAGRTAVEEQMEANAAAPRKGLVKDFLALTKPVVVALLLVTTLAGMVIGAGAWPSLSLAGWVLLGGFMAAGGSGAINQYIDRYDDIKMQRTSRRPIPAGRLTPGEGLAFGVGMALASFYLMVAFVNFLAALLTLAGIIYYVLLYSIILKKATVQNIVIGGGAGAIPPLVGWAAATGSLNIPSLFLFAVIFMWTPPHFWALALVRRNDYARAGVPMLPVVRGERETRWQIFLYTLELVALTLVLPLFGLGGGIYLVSAALLGGALLFSAWRVWRGQGNKVAWMMYRHSSMYLAFLFLALVVDVLW